MYLEKPVSYCNLCASKRNRPLPSPENKTVKLLARNHWVLVNAPVSVDAKIVKYPALSNTTLDCEISRNGYKLWIVLEHGGSASAADQIIVGLGFFQSRILVSLGFF